MLIANKEPFELVIHKDEAGVRATATYRKRIYDDSKLLSTEMEGVTLADLGAAFPWGEFVDAAAQEALTQTEAALAKVAEKEATIAAKDAEIASLRERLALKPPPADALERAMFAVDEELSRREAEGFTFMTKRIDTSPRGIRNISNMALTARELKSRGAAFSRDWVTADGSKLTLSRDDIINMQLAMAQSGAALFDHAQALKAQITAAVDPSSIDVTAGWPAV